MPKRRSTADIQIRDPFVLTRLEERRYYLYGTTDPDPWTGPGIGFDVFVGNDLELWEGPFPAFHPPPDFWADRNFWAPEVYELRGVFYLLASFKAEGAARAVQCFRSSSPLGPFEAHGPGPLTPESWECLDGTLFIDDDGSPWLLFCREWLQVDDGEICACRLSTDLETALGEPRVLFRASEAPWVRPVQERHHFVTDGPFPHRAESGDLLLLWSSFSKGGYSVGLARSSSGELSGPWRHDRRPLVQGDGGHAMLFRSLGGELLMTYHSPNRTPDERAVFAPVHERRGSLRITGPPSKAAWRRLLWPRPDR